MPRAKKQPWRCKHFVEEDDGTSHRCKRKAKDTGWCATHEKMHRTPLPTGEHKIKLDASSLKHGFYAKGFTEEEKRQLVTSTGGPLTLDNELLIARAQLRRVWIACGMALNLEDPAAGMEVVEQRQLQELAGPMDNPVIVSRRTEVLRRRPDLAYHLDRCLRTVERLVLTQANLIAGNNGPGTPGSVADAMQRAAEELRLYDAAQQAGRGAGGNGHTAGNGHTGAVA